MATMTPIVLRYVEHGYAVPECSCSQAEWKVDKVTVGDGREGSSCPTFHPSRPSEDLLCALKRPALAASLLGTLGMLPKASIPGPSCSWFVLLKESQLSSGL